MSDVTVPAGLQGLISALAAIQRAAASGTLIVRGGGGGALAFERGAVCRVLRESGSQDPAETPLPPPDVRGRARDLLRAGAAALERVTFHAEAPSQGAAEVVGLNAGDLILDLVKEAADPAWIRKEIAQAPTKIAANGAPPPVLPRLALTPSEGFLMSRADGTLSVEEILAVSPIPEDETLKSLYALLAAGLLVAPGAEIIVEMRLPAPAPPKRRLADLDAFLTKTSSQGSAAPVSSGENAAPPTPAPAAAAPSPAPAAAAEAAPSDKAPGPRALSRDIEDSREQVLTRISECQGANHYRVLGVDRTADENAVRRAYYKIAKRFHPDRFRRPGFEEIIGEIESMFATTTEAYNTLTGEKTRYDYDRLIADQACGARSQDVDHVTSARESYLRARKHLDSGDLFDALRLLETACQTDPSRAEYLYYLGLVQTRNPKWRKKAEANFLKVIEMSPADTRAYLQLAQLYKSGGLAHRAAEMFEKVLEWEPDNEEALVELGRKKGHPSTSTGRHRTTPKGPKS